MRAMKLKHGVVFAERDGITLRFLHGKWEISPIAYDALEWDLRGDGPDAYEYFTESDLRGLGDAEWAEMNALFDKRLEARDREPYEAPRRRGVFCRLRARFSRGRSDSRNEK